MEGPGMARMRWQAVAAGLSLAAGLAFAEDEWRRVADLKAGGGPKDVKVTGSVSRILLRCDSGAVTVNTLFVVEKDRKTPLPVTTEFKEGDARVIDLQQNVSVSALRVTDAGGGSYSVHVK
jgi:hypothetical protein